ncbi:MAG: MraY family glycosyltransferase [Burkholderiaceae bacterium]
MISSLDAFSTGLIAASTTFILSLLIIVTRNWHSRFSLDPLVKGPQKFHSIPVPRIGGIAVYGGIAAAVLLLEADKENHHSRLDVLKLLAAAAPLFFAGLLEDITKNASIRIRIIAAMLSALCAAVLLSAVLPRLDLWGVDQLAYLLPPAVALLVASGFTIFAVTGASNSINIIDGFNGLAGATVAVILGGLAFLAWRAGDSLVVELAVLGIGAAIGFMFLNYPRGTIFLGDGGAYFLGFWMAEIAVLLVARNPSVGTWQVLAVCGYPIIETVFSIYRKLVIRRMSPGLPDALHFHMLIYRRVTRNLCRSSAQRPWLRNALVAPIIATGVLANVVLVLVLGSSTSTALALLAFQAWIYMMVYTRMVCMSWKLLTPLHSPRGLTRRAQPAPALQRVE